MEMVLDQVCASCGSDRLADGRFCLFCGDVFSDPAHPNKRSSPAANLPRADPSHPVPLRYAGFWRRLWAAAIDVSIEATGALLLALAIEVVLRGFGTDWWSSKVFAGVAYVPILAVGSWLYCAFAESSRWRATIGKRALGLQVIGVDGEKLSFGQATVRHFMKFLSFFCLTIGFLMPVWTKRRQALHDMPCDCIVIRTPPATSLTATD